jgi:hypothetical protein
MSDIVIVSAARTPVGSFNGALSSLPAQDSPCPVPPEQRPLEEYVQLQGSWFFRWPTGGDRSLARALTLAWLLALRLWRRRQPRP